MLVSVVMSVYNADEYLDKSINSILNQTFKDYEFVIVDDGSKDKSKEILRKYAAHDSRIVLIENQTNLGLAASLNKGISIAKGTYIARQDADDISDPNRLQLQIDYALQHPEVDVIGSNSFIIDIHDHIVCRNIHFSAIKDYKEHLLKKKAIFPHGSAFLKRSKLLEAGLYDTRFYFSQDGELWLRLIHKGAEVHVIDKPLYFYRQAPVTTDKKTIKWGYNRVKNMIYAHKSDPKEITLELEKINNKLLKNKWKARPFYMADYWKGLANTAYIHKGKTTSIYRYILKAMKEENPLRYYPKYMALSLLYLLPPRLTINALKRLHQKVN